MTTMSHPFDVSDSKEKRRVVVLKIFLAMAIINNLYIAVACFAFGGGRLLNTAPAWAVLAIGSMAGLTVLGAILGLLWKRIGVLAIICAGVVATGCSVLAALWFQAGLFAMGTAFMALLAYHLWHRFVPLRAR